MRDLLSWLGLFFPWFWNGRAALEAHLTTVMLSRGWGTRRRLFGRSTRSEWFFLIEGIRNPQVETLCLSAEADESTLQYPLPEHIFGFHSQQSVEKLLKALVSVHGRSHPRAHSVEQLLNWLAELDERLPDLPFDLSLLEPYSVLFHYEFGVNSLPERDVVAVLKRYVFARIVELQGSSEAEG